MQWDVCYLPYIGSSSLPLDTYPLPSTYHHAQFTYHNVLNQQKSSRQRTRSYTCTPSPNQQISHDFGEASSTMSLKTIPQISQVERMSRGSENYRSSHSPVMLLLRVGFRSHWRSEKRRFYAVSLRRLTLLRPSLAEVALRLRPGDLFIRVDRRRDRRGGVDGVWAGFFS